MTMALWRGPWSRAALCSVCLAILAGCTQSYRVEFEPEPGSARSVSYRLEATLESAVDAMTVYGSLRVTSAYTMQIVDRSEAGDTTVEVTADDLGLDVSLRIGQLDVYAVAAALRGNEPNQALSLLEGSRLTLIVAPTGRISRIDGLDELRQAVAGHPGLEPAARDLLEGWLRDEVVRNLFEQILAVYPDRELTPGLSWTAPIQLDERLPPRWPLPMRVEATYTAQADLPSGVGYRWRAESAGAVEQGAVSALEAEGEAAFGMDSGWAERVEETYRVAGSLGLDDLPGVRSVPLGDAGLEVPVTVHVRKSIHSEAKGQR